MVGRVWGEQVATQAGEQVATGTGAAKVDKGASTLGFYDLLDDTV